MPNSASARKNLRQNEKRRIQNKMVRTALRTVLAKLRAAVKAGSFEEADSLFRLAAKKLDQGAAKKIIHKNAASRSKSRLSHMIKTAKAGKATAA
jgi:small subunit ribosomal protein S20